MAKRKLAAFVRVTDPAGAQVWLRPGAPVPEWAGPQLTNPAVWDNPDPEPEQEQEPEPVEPVEPVEQGNTDEPAPEPDGSEQDNVPAPKRRNTKK